MTSLAEVYEGVGGTSLRRIYLGTSLFAGGAILVISAIIIASTDILAGYNIGTFGSRRIAGLLAGVGVPAVFVGIFTVLPANPRERATAAIGGSVALFGVVLFWEVYPGQWYGATPDHLTLPVVVVYFIGLITTFWALFTAVVNFKTRNDPGGTITLKRTVEGETQFVEVPLSEVEGKTLQEASTGSSVGVLGGVDKNEVMRPSDDATTESEGEIMQGRNSNRSQNDSSPASDGGVMPGEPRPSANRSDKYCGNCQYFAYEQSADGYQPSCGYYESLMDDMEACENWEPNLATPDAR